MIMRCASLLHPPRQSFHAADREPEAWAAHCTIDYTAPNNDADPDDTSPTASPRAGYVMLSMPGLKERAGEVLPMVVLTGLDTWDLLLVPLPGLSGHACVYSYLSALNVMKNHERVLARV